ncbi:hypothetical protein D3C71_1722730 [compost metagenome]
MACVGLVSAAPARRLNVQASMLTANNEIEVEMNKFNATVHGPFVLGMRSAWDGSDGTPATFEWLNTANIVSIYAYGNSVFACLSPDGDDQKQVTVAHCSSHDDASRQLMILVRKLGGG